MNLKMLGAHARELRERSDNGLLPFMRWTPPQLAFLKVKNKRKLLRAGNQVGKSYVGLAEVIYLATGSHPFGYGVKDPPLEIWIVTTSWAQGVSLHKKFWELVPKDMLTSRSRASFDPRRGFGKDNPAVSFLNGSIIRFRTTNQGAEALAGATIDHILIDEPCDLGVYRELDRRLIRTNGTLAFTLTPINRPTDWLKELVEEGIIEEVHARMVPENFVPVGSTRPLCLPMGIPLDAVWIEEQRRVVLKRYAPVLLDGEWETRNEAPLFEAFAPDIHVTTEIPKGNIKVALGIDHGSGRNFKQIAVLIAMDTRDEYPKMHVLDECPSDGDTTPERDARAILMMLKRNGLKWRDLDHVFGDRAYSGRGVGGLGRKSNKTLTKAVKKALSIKVSIPLKPAIRTAKTGKGGGRGSVWRGCVWIHRSTLREGCFTVHPRCVRVIESMQKFDFRDNDWKDAIDALRYASWPWVMRGKATQGRGLYVY